MKVFIAGATGAIGAPLVEKLLDRNHTVYGLARTEESAAKLKKAGVIPVKGDALDAQSVLQAVVGVRPDVVVEQLTSLPKDNTPEARRAAAAVHNRTRREGGANLQAAAIAAGAKRYVAQSSAFLCVPGEGLATESVGLATDVSAPGTAATASALADVEQRVLSATDIEGVVLRYGFFYGPGTWYEKGCSTANQVQAQESPIVGSGDGLWSFVHVEDAASATVAAIEIDDLGARLFNITDNKPVAIKDWLPSYAHYIGASAPPALSENDAREKLGEDAVFYGTKLRGVSNELARQRLGFNPRPLVWTE
jgi:nucleoside-diphosphate-sugar epimerase